MPVSATLSGSPRDFTRPTPDLLLDKRMLLPQNQTPISVYGNGQAKEPAPRPQETAIAVDLGGLARGTPACLPACLRAYSLLPQCPAWFYGSSHREQSRESEPKSTGPSSLGPSRPSPTPPTRTLVKAEGVQAKTLFPKTRHPTHKSSKSDGITFLDMHIGLGSAEAGDDRLAAGE